MGTRGDGLDGDGAAEDAEREVVFATFQPGRLRKWSRGEMRRLSAEDIQQLLESRRAIVLENFESADGARFGPSQAGSS